MPKLGGIEFFYSIFVIHLLEIRVRSYDEIEHKRDLKFKGKHEHKLELEGKHERLILDKRKRKLEGKNRCKLKKKTWG